MKRLDWYILEELLPPFIVGVLIIVVMILGDQLYNLMRLILTKGVPPGEAFHLLLFKFPEVLVMALPMSLILAISLAFNRLERERELPAMRVGGQSLLALLGPALVFGVGVAGLDFFINEKIAPKTSYAFANLRLQMTLRNPTPLIEPRTFFQPPGESDTYIYIGEVDNETQELRNVLIFMNLRGDYPQVILARRSHYSEGIWFLQEVIQHQWHPNGVLMREMRDNEVTLNLEQIVQEAWAAPKSAAERNLRELKELIDTYENAHVPVTDMQIEWHQKWSLPASCLVLVLLAVPLNIRFAHAGSYAGLLLTVVLVFLHFIGQVWFEQFGRSGSLPPFLAAWGQNFLFGGIGLLMLWRIR